MFARKMFLRNMFLRNMFLRKMFLRKLSLKTSCGITACKKRIDITKKYNCNEICVTKCDFDDKLNNLLNCSTNGFFVIEFNGTVLLNNDNTPVNDHIMIVEKNKNEYIMHQSFLFTYTETKKK